VLLNEINTPVNSQNKMRVDSLIILLKGMLRNQEPDWCQ